MALAPGASTTLTFNNVLDFASNQDQYAVWMYGDVRANQFLFRGWMYDSGYISRFPIMLGSINDTSSQMLVDVDPTQIGKTSLGITWLPGGSGFLYSVTELVNDSDQANIWEYSFATGQSKRVTNMPFCVAREITDVYIFRNT